MPFIVSRVILAGILGTLVVFFSFVSEQTKFSNNDAIELNTIAEKRSEHRTSSSTAILAKTQSTTSSPLKPQTKLLESEIKISESPKKVPETPKTSESPTANIRELPVFQPSSNLSELNLVLRSSIVNILCTSKLDEATKSITGSGVMIDPRGIILTNAHVAQYLLLRNFNAETAVDCTARTGSPAYPTYSLEILFMPKKWVEENKKNIVSENPLGTGEHDFALLAISGRIDKTPVLLPTPFITPNTEDSDIDQDGLVPHITLGYPAGFLGGIAVERDLYVTSAITYIKQVFTFKETTIDLISIGGTILAQKGSSGGAVVSSKNKKLIGLIVTTSDGITTAERDLRAITLSHVGRSLKEETGKNISEFLEGDLNEKIVRFKNDSLPYLAGLLVEEINR